MITTMMSTTIAIVTTKMTMTVTMAMTMAMTMMIMPVPCHQKRGRFVGSKLLYWTLQSTQSAEVEATGRIQTEIKPNKSPQDRT